MTNEERKNQKKKKKKGGPLNLFKRTSEGEWKYICFTLLENATFYLYISLLPVFRQLNEVIKGNGQVVFRVD